MYLSGCRLAGDLPARRILTDCYDGERFVHKYVLFLKYEYRQNSTLSGIGKKPRALPTESPSTLSPGRRLAVAAGLTTIVSLMFIVTVAYIDAFIYLYIALPALIPVLFCLFYILTAMALLFVEDTAGGTKRDIGYYQIP